MRGIYGEFNNKIYIYNFIYITIFTKSLFFNMTKKKEKKLKLYSTLLYSL